MVSGLGFGFSSSGFRVSGSGFRDDQQRRIQTCEARGDDQGRARSRKLSIAHTFVYTGYISQPSNMPRKPSPLAPRARAALACMGLQDEGLRPLACMASGFQTSEGEFERVEISGLGMRVSCFGVSVFRVSEACFRISGLRFRVPGFGLTSEGEFEGVERAEVQAVRDREYGRVHGAHLLVEHQLLVLRGMLVNTSS